jgi:hypothetical protein
MRTIHSQQTQVNTDFSTNERLKEKLLDKKENQGMVIGTNTNNTHGMRTLSLQNTQVNTDLITEADYSPNLQPKWIAYDYINHWFTSKLTHQKSYVAKISEICHETGYSRSTVEKAIAKLVKVGKIRKYTRRIANTYHNTPCTYYIPDTIREARRKGLAVSKCGKVVSSQYYSGNVAKKKLLTQKEPSNHDSIEPLAIEQHVSQNTHIIVSKDTNNRNTSKITKEGNQVVIKKKVLECPLGPIKAMIGTEIAKNSRFVEYHPQDTKGCETLLNALATENRWFNATLKTLKQFQLNTAELQLLFEDFFSYKRRKYSQGIMISPYLQLKLKRNLDNIESLNFEMCNFGKHWFKIYRRKLSKNQKFIKYDEYEQKRADNLLAGMRKTVENMIRDVQNKVIMKQEQNKVNKALSEYYRFIEKHPDAQDYIEHYIEQNMDYPTFYRYLDERYPDPDMRNELQIFIMINGQKLRKALMELVSKKPVDKTPIIDLNVLTPFEFGE